MFIILLVFIGIIGLLLIVKIVKIKKIINKRVNGEKLTFRDLKKFNTWTFYSFGVDERITLENDKVFVVYEYHGFNEKEDLNTYEDLYKAIEDYSCRTKNKIDRIIYDQYENKRVKKIC